MAVKIEREAVGYKYTDETDSDRSEWDVTTDYINDKIYLEAPDEDDLVAMAAFGKALVKACRDMKAEKFNNRFPVS
jgi:hypothetical protein